MDDEGHRTGGGLMSQTASEVLVVSRARFGQIDLETMASLRNRVLNVFSGVPGFISTSIWEQVEDPFSFLMVGHFSSVDDSLKAWDLIVRSPVMEVIGDLLVEAPNSQRFFLRRSSGLSLENTKPGHFLSLSARLADMGYGRDVLDELDRIFTELKLIPGFLGYVTGQMTEIEDEVLGLAFWESRQAYEASIPKKALYKIDLYTRAL